MNPTQLNNLKGNLNRYGLKPNEWLLKPRKNNLFEIHNKNQKTLKMIGFTNKTNQDWTYIQIISL